MSENQYILQIDTATEVCSVSLASHGRIIDFIDAAEPNQHASGLTVFIDELLRRNLVSYTDLSAVAVSMGPGSYTGLRIGVSTAKGLCYSLDIPLIAVNTLELMYEGYLGSFTDMKSSFYCAMLDARRMEVYLSVYDANGGLAQATEARIIDENSFAQYKDIVLFGSGAGKLEFLFEEHPDVVVDNRYKHSSKYMTRIVAEKFETSSFEDLIYFEPFYLKEFVPTMPKKLL